MTKCRLCGNEAGNEKFRAREMMWGTGDSFDYIMCSRCGCLQIVDIPDDMSKYYPRDYYSYKVRDEPGAGGLKGFLLKARDAYAFGGRGLLGHGIHLLKPAMPILKDLGRAGITMDSRILDVGCGNGETIHYLGNIGFRHLAGVDPFATGDIAYGNGVKVFKRTIHEMDGAFDLIVFNHSFEHMPDPAETMQSVRRLLAPGGVCLIKVPTVASFAWEKYGVDWVQLDAPRHFFLYTPDNIRQLASGAGLSVTGIVDDSGDLQFWGSEQYRKGIAFRAENSYFVNPAASIFTRSEIKEFRRQARELNRSRRGDSISAYLKKDR